jgi:hypothetical protein
MRSWIVRLGGLAVLAGLLVPGAALGQEDERGITGEAVPIDEILKEFSKANENVKAISGKVESVKTKQQELLDRIGKGEKIPADQVWVVKEEFVNVLFDQYNAFNTLRSYEYKIVGALKRVEYKIQSQERYLNGVIGEIDGLIDRYKQSMEVLKDRIRVEENVEGQSSERVLALKRQRRTLEYMLKAYQRFGEYASKVHVLHVKRQQAFSEKLKVFGEKLGQLPYIVASLKNALRVTHQIYHTSSLFEEMPDITDDVKAFIEGAGEFGFGKDFEETLKVMSQMPEIFVAQVPEGPSVSPEEQKDLQDEFKKIEQKYRK